mmetsp:Transcript_9850/g.40025  ORF Transcript_9850/g.40025 Transcript_9850/m.40025 type:complete len:149 (+) Transcript_9850:775-1221(+)
MAARHRENNQRPEARASGCCGHLRPRHYLRLSFGIAALVVAIFAAGALGAPAWAEGSVKFFDGTVDVTARANLWRIHIKRSGAFDDDVLTFEPASSSSWWAAEALFGGGILRSATPPLEEADTPLLRRTTTGCGAATSTHARRGARCD